MTKWKVIFVRCNHQAILTDKQLHNPIEQHRNPASPAILEDIYVCPGCSGGESGRVQPGFCHNTVLHSVHRARKLTPLEERSLLSSQ